MQSSPFIYVLIMNVLVYNVNQKMANLHFSSPGRFIGGVLSSSLLSFYEGNENMSINFKNFRLSFNEISFHEKVGNGFEWLARREQWRRIPYTGDIPVPEEWLRYAVEKIRADGRGELLYLPDDREG